MDDRQHPGQESRPKVEAIPAEQTASFAILRRGQAQSDQLRRDRGDALDDGPIGQRHGLNSALARRAVTQIGDVWVVPGNGYLALVAAGGAVCTETEVIVGNGTVTWTSHDGQGIVHGLVPDGVSEVTLFAAGEPLRFLQPGAEARRVPKTVAVKENVYGAALPGEFMSGRYTGPAGAIDFGPWAH